MININMIAYGHRLRRCLSEAFDVTYLSEEQEREYVWATSWGVSTRLIGAVIMAPRRIAVSRKPFTIKNNVYIYINGI